jgi:hypothetical protein
MYQQEAIVIYLDQEPRIIYLIARDQEDPKALSLDPDHGELDLTELHKLPNPGNTQLLNSIVTLHLDDENQNKVTKITPSTNHDDYYLYLICDVCETSHANHKLIDPFDTKPCECGKTQLAADKSCAVCAAEKQTCIICAAPRK